MGAARRSENESVSEIISARREKVHLSTVYHGMELDRRGKLEMGAYFTLNQHRVQNRCGRLYFRLIIRFYRKVTKINFQIGKETKGMVYVITENTSRKLLNLQIYKS